MATTHVPKYDQPIVVSLEDIRAQAQDWLETSMGDFDKAGEMQDWFFYEGFANGMESLLMFMTGQKPEETDASS